MMFFNGWFGLLRVVVVGTLAYGILIGMLRLSGKRTLAKMNAFDLVVTVSLGSTLATTLLSKDVALAEGATSFGLLILLQFMVAYFSVRSERFQNWVSSEPTLLVRRGRYLREAMRRERVTEEDVLAALRAEGKSSLAQAEAVVLESDGSFTMISGGNATSIDDSALAGLDETDDPRPSGKP